MIWWFALICTLFFSVVAAAAFHWADQCRKDHDEAGGFYGALMLAAFTSLFTATGTVADVLAAIGVVVLLLGSK